MSMLTTDKVIMNATAQDKYEAIRMAGQILKDAGHITADYIEKMIEREEIVSTYVGTAWLFRMVQRNPKLSFYPQVSLSFSIHKVLILAKKRLIWSLVSRLKAGNIWRS